MVKNSCPPNLDHRFCEPEGWRWHSFEREGRKIRFGSVFPQDSIPDAVVVCLQGAREFTEKYYETAHWCLDQNLAFWICDWVGQGKSTRLLTNPQKLHCDDFDNHVEDLQYFILQYIKHSSVHPDKGRIPLTMLAHSMGAHIGLRHLCKYPGMFECAALSAPMMGIKILRKYPQSLTLAAGAICNTLMGKSYVPKGNDWGKRAEKARLSRDPERSKVHDIWCDHDPELQCGDVTYGWVYQAHRSCMALKKSLSTDELTTPCLFGIPQQEDLVDNALAGSLISKMPNAKILEYPNAYHELLMEKDDVRDNFLTHYYELIKQSIIDRPETLKPF